MRLMKSIFDIYKNIFSRFTYDGLLLFILTGIASINVFSSILIDILGKEKVYLYIIINFILSIAYIAVTLFKKNRYWIKISLILLLILNFLIINFHYINYRKVDEFNVHDGVIQMELATDYFLQGKNPYSENYFDTAFSRWHNNFSPNKEIIPTPIYHYPYPPFSFIFSAPFYFIGKQIGFYDERILFLILFLLSSLLVFKIPQEKNKKLLALIFFVFNPMLILSLMYGSNNILTIFWMILLFYFIKLDKLLISSIVLGLAIGIKQSVWFLIPFYFFYIYLKEKKKLAKTLKLVWPVIIIPIILFTPFIIWDYESFIDDILLFPTGASETSFPIQGIGISAILLQFNIINSPSDSFPSWIFHLFFSLPILFYLLKKQIKNNTPESMYFYYLIFLFVFWFFSRYFHSDHLFYILTMFIIILLINDKKADKIREKLQNK